jgi:AAA domain
LPTFYSDIVPVQIDDIFPGWILTADVSSLTAIGGGGKGVMSGDVMSRVSQGWPMPPWSWDDPTIDPEACATPGYVLHCTLEDAADRTVWWRLNAAGADMTKIAMLDQLSLPEDFGKLRSEIEAIGDVRLVTIDPWMSAATRTTSFNQALRLHLLNPMIHLARETGVGIWLLNHFTKGTNNGRLAPNSNKNLTDYVAGSKAFTDTLRMNTVVVDSDLDPKLKQWKFLKGNGGGCDPLEYTIVASRPNDPDCHVEWKQPLPNLNDPRVFERIQARVLDELIAANGPVSPQQMVQLLGQSFAIVNRAMKNLEATGAATKRRGAYEAQPSISPARAAAAPQIAPPAGSQAVALFDQMNARWAP